MPNRCGPAMQIFTKILKIPFSFLTEKSVLPVVYIDDAYLQASVHEDCFFNVMNTKEVLRFLGSQSTHRKRQIQIHSNTMHHLVRISK